MIPGNLAAPGFAHTCRSGLEADNDALGARSITLGGPTSNNDDGSYGRPLTFGAGRESVDGSPATPCLALNFYGCHTFRWAAPSGARTISVKVKQADNRSPYPTLVVKKNAALGIGADVTGTSPGGTGWVTIGPVTVSPTVSGVLIVELWNNSGYRNAPTYFDHISVT